MNASSGGVANAADVVIVGGGVIGCSIAYHLAGAGKRVTLVERAAIAAEASSAAAGMLAPITEAYDEGSFSELAVAGLRCFQEDAAAIESVSGVTVEYLPSGIIRTATIEEPERARALQERTAWAKSVGLPVQWLDGEALRRLEPAIGSGVVGGLDSPEEGQVSPRRLTLALAQGAARRSAVIREGADVETLVRSGDAVVGVRLTTGELITAATVVLAGGSWARFCARGTADLPVRPVKGQYLLLRRMPCPIRRVLFGEHAYLLPRPDGTIYCGSTEEPERGFDKHGTASAVRTLLNAAAELAPAIDEAELLSTGAGLRPGSPDRMPLLGDVPGVTGLVVAAGHFRNGILLSLITGRLLTESIVYGRTSMD
ncbi:MAG: glycine oxidase ThiO, partial [Dehalococcoidia bacterium]